MRLRDDGLEAEWLKIAEQNVAKISNGDVVQDWDVPVTDPICRHWHRDADGARLR